MSTHVSGFFAFVVEKRYHISGVRDNRIVRLLRGFAEIVTIINIMAEKKHSVKASLQVLELTKAGSAIKLDVYSGATKLGTVRIGHGSIGWKPVNRQSFASIDWSSFAKLMDEHWHGS